MSDQPLTVARLTKALMEFHRDVIRPEFQRDLTATVEASERRLTAQIEDVAGKLVDLQVRRIERRIGPSEDR